jgi:hypothetical protein
LEFFRVRDKHGFVELNFWRSVLIDPVYLRRENNFLSLRWIWSSPRNLIFSIFAFLQTIKIATVDCGAPEFSNSMGAACGCPEGAPPNYDECMSFASASLACASLNYHQNVLAAECGSLKELSEKIAAFKSIDREITDADEEGGSTRDGSLLAKASATATSTGDIPNSPMKGVQVLQDQALGSKYCLCAADNDGSVCVCRCVAFVNHSRISFA